jgi:hypothetical protein
MALSAVSGYRSPIFRLSSGFDATLSLGDVGQRIGKYGLRLMPELYEYLNPMPYEAAAQMEKDLAEDLRADGYTVAGGT